MLDIVKSGSNGNGAISGRGLRRRKLTVNQRIDLAADLVSGQRQRRRQRASARRHFHDGCRAAAARAFTGAEISLDDSKRGGAA